MTALFRLPATTTYNAEQALQSALHENLSDALIVGYDEDGELFVRSSRMTCAEAVFIAFKLIRWAESGGEG